VRLLVRLFVGISVATLLVVGGFAYHEVREERARLQQDLKRRAVLIADAVREAVEPVILRGVPIEASPSTTSSAASSTRPSTSSRTSPRCPRSSVTPFATTRRPGA